MSNVIHGRDVSGDVSIDADVVVCGSGAGGGMAAMELARAGLRVVLLEEGRDFPVSEFSQREEQMIPELFQKSGGQRTDDLSIAILTGRGVGGSTLHNTNLCKRIPNEILHEWAERHRLPSLHPSRMNPLFDEVESLLGVRPIAEAQINRANDLVRSGALSLGYKNAVLHHNRDERCNGCGFCELGCSYDAKLNARRVLVAEALHKGAQVYADARVSHVEISGRQVTRVEARFLNASGRPRGRLSVRAQAVCLAGGAIGSATMALRSSIPDPYGQLGRGLHIHPAAIIAGVFEHEVNAWEGVPQSVQCTEFMDYRPGAAHRVWIVPSFAHPVGAAVMAPGFGPEWMARMRPYSKLVVLAAMVHDETEGRVTVRSSNERIRYQPNRADREQLALGAREAAKILFAAGAKEVWVPGAHPLTLRSPREVSTISEGMYRPNEAKIMSVHPMGTLRMGHTPRNSVVDEQGRHHQVRGLYVVDGSLFPTSIGGPPQIGIYTLALKIARQLASDLRG